MKARAVITINIADVDQGLTRPEREAGTRYDRRDLLEELEELEDIVRLELLADEVEVSAEIVHVEGQDAWHCICRGCERLRRDAEPDAHV
jgi:hypothetical protein